MGGWTRGWIDGRLDGWVNEWMNWWIDCELSGWRGWLGGKKKRLNSSTYLNVECRRFINSILTLSDQVVVEPEVDTSYQTTYCQRKKVLVNLPQPADGSGIHWPYCASVPRCSGCCSTVSALQKCTAVRTSTRRVDVYYIPYGKFN